MTGQSVRAVKIDGKPMFLASEVADILGYTNPQKAVRDHYKYPKLFKQNESFTLKICPYGINMIPESDVYRLIMRSKLPAAEQFEAWVMEIVLPVNDAAFQLNSSPFVFPVTGQTEASPCS